jgi:hypothetical protein
LDPNDRDRGLSLIVQVFEDDFENRHMQGALSLGMLTQPGFPWWLIALHRISAAFKIIKVILFLKTRVRPTNCFVIVAIVALAAIAIVAIADIAIGAIAEIAIIVIIAIVASAKNKTAAKSEESTESLTVIRNFSTPKISPAGMRMCTSGEKSRRGALKAFWSTTKPAVDLQVWQSSLHSGYFLSVRLIISSSSRMSIAELTSSVLSHSPRAISRQAPAASMSSSVNAAKREPGCWSTISDNR